MSAPVAVGVIAVTAMVGMPVVFAGAALEARHSTASAADSAALAAADAALGFLDGEPCGYAEMIAEAYHVVLQSCEIGSTDARIIMSSTGLFGSVSQRARAGIPPSHGEGA